MSPTVSVVVMAHRKREAYIPGLLAALDRPAEVVWDAGDNNRWNTGRRAWQAVDRSTSHGLTIQDDAIPCRDLVAGIEQALQHVPPDSPLCLYCGRTRPYRELVQRLVTEAGQETSWLTMAQCHWGVGIVMPTKWIDDMVAWCDTRSEIANYDRRISRWIQHQGLTVYYPWPSLVDHRISPSLVPGRQAAGRHAHRFLGADRSALDQDWGGRVAAIPQLSAVSTYVPRHRPVAGPPRPRRPRLGVAVKFISTKYPSLQVPAARVRFRDGVAVTRDPDSIAVLLLPQVRAMGVEPAEPAPAGPDAANGQGTADPPPASVDGDQDQDPVADEPADGEVPQGNAEEVLAWVGDDPDRARLALDAEQARDKPRTTLAAKLTKLAGTVPAPTEVPA